MAIRLQRGNKKNSDFKITWIDEERLSPQSLATIKKPFEFVAKGDRCQEFNTHVGDPTGRHKSVLHSDQFFVVVMLSIIAIIWLTLEQYNSNQKKQTNLLNWAGVCVTLWVLCKQMGN